MLKERLPEIKVKTDVNELYTDGGYYSEEGKQIAGDNKVNVHYTDMTDRKANADRIPLTDFAIENQRKITACPQGQVPQQSYYNEGKKVLTAYFEPERCSQCLVQDNCPVKVQKTKAVPFYSFQPCRL